MNQLLTYNNLSDGHTSRRYTGFPLNSTLVSTYTSDTIRSIISHAATGKPYTTAVWIRISRVGIQISAQDPQIARTRIPVFIPVGLVNDIFMQPTIANVICIVYDELKSNMKGVLLYVVHPTDAHILREDFRLFKQLSYTKGIENPLLIDTNSSENNHLFSPTSQHSSEVYQRNGKTPRQQSPKRVLYVRDNNTNPNKEITPTSLPQISYTPLKGSYHSNRDDSAHRRHKSPRKPKSGHTPNKTSNDNGPKHKRKYRSRSPQKQVKPQLPVKNNSDEKINERTNQEQEQQKQQQEQLLLQQQQQQQQQQLLLQQQQIAAWQAAQQMPVIPMGIYNRYVPKTIPLANGETIQTAVSPSFVNGNSIPHNDQENGINGHNSTRSPSRSRSTSPKRQDPQRRNRPLSAQNGEASAVLIQSSHHHHHHRRHHHTNGHNHSSSKPETNIYNTISHSSRTLSKYIPTAINNSNNNNNNDNDNETRQYLKQLIDDMQAMKLEMNKIRLASSSVGTTRGRADSLRVNLKELRHDIDAIRARMAMTPRAPK